jgi:ABC-type polysaccharide/polyol phosphate transport system ATPase subunit
MRTYSSGMYVRLGFAVAVHVRPEILIVDEVLAVGDAEFQRKCFEHIEKLRQDKVTIVLVTHDLESVKRFCDRAVLLNHGGVAAAGRPQEVVDEYLSRHFEFSASPSGRGDS